MRFLVIAVASVILFFPAFWLFNAAVGPDWGAGIAAFAMYIAFPVLAMKLWSPTPVNELPSMEQALLAGDLTSVEYSVTDAIEIEELEDEGKHFYLAVAQEQTLFLSGQYLHDPVKRGVFPSTRIRIYLNQRLGFTYGVECFGHALQSHKRLPPFSEERLQNDGIPRDRQIIENSLSRVEVGLL